MTVKYLKRVLQWAVEAFFKQLLIPNGEILEESEIM